MTITGGSSLPKDDIERMMQEAQEHADEDKQRREEAETRNLAEGLQCQTEKFLAENGEKLPADKKSEMRTRLSASSAARWAVRTSRTSSTAQEKLAKVSQEAGAAMYAQGQAGGEGASAGAEGAAGQPGGEQAGPAGGATGASAGGKEDVVDAEIVDEDDKK